VENTVRGLALAWRTCCGEDECDDYAAGLGGVMLGSSEWAGGLRDRVLPVLPEQRETVEPELNRASRQLLDNLSPYLGLNGRAREKHRTGTQG
jgi:hypothetical protein